MSNSTSFKPTNYLYYLALLAVFGLGIWFILNIGSGLQPNVQLDPSAVVSTQSSRDAALKLNDRSPLSVLLLQIIVIIVVARFVGGIFRRIGQPPVMGEMVAGIALGPSVLGWLWPQASAFLFPAASMPTLGLLSQLGVVLFMFIVGVELDLQHLRQRASSAVMVSHASIIVPFLFGAALALALYPPLGAPNTTFTQFGLFMGIAMSITAFPVLARILQDRNLVRSPLGVTALTCAAVGDATAWCILAVVIATVNATGLLSSALTIALTVVFVIVMLWVIKPRVETLIERRVSDASSSRLVMAVILAFALSSAWITETIGIHALFGGFLAGVVMPSTAGVQAFLKERIETFSSVALLPLFFVFTGLRTQITLLNDWWTWLICFAIIIVAIAGKLCGSMFTARWTGMSWRDSFGLGALMNTRGLMELVVLNIGYDLGILSNRIFVMMVIMALATTFMTAPLLSLAKLGKAR